MGIPIGGKTSPYLLCPKTALVLRNCRITGSFCLPEQKTGRVAPRLQETFCDTPFTFVVFTLTIASSRYLHAQQILHSPQIKRTGIDEMRVSFYRMRWWNPPPYRMLIALPTTTSRFEAAKSAQDYLIKNGGDFIAKH